MKTAVPICVKCRYCRQPYMGPSRMCTQEMRKELDPVTGHLELEGISEPCYKARLPTGRCGPEGRLFERFVWWNWRMWR